MVGTDGYRLTPQVAGLTVVGPVAAYRCSTTPAHRTRCGKVARVHDVAMAVVYLASTLSGHVSGQILTVSGGMEGRVLYDPNEVDPQGA
jgi:3-oxoacyl-[acyl-carrier protein] reductase